MTKKSKSKITRKTSSGITKKAKVQKTARTRSNSNPFALAMVPYDEIQKVETYRGNMSVVPTPLSGKQIEMLVAPTNPKYVLKRPGKGGKQFNYIPGWYFKKKLNFIFGWMWDFQILGERIDGDFVTVKGKIVIKNAKGQILVEKTDFGGHPIMYLSGGKNYLDISNDFKAAATDCLKRCATQLGIGLDVYSAGDYTNPENPEAPLAGPSVVKQAQFVPDRTAPNKPLEVQVEVDHIKRLNDHLAHKAGTTIAQKKAYLRDLIGPMAATRYEQLGSKITQQQAQQVLGSIFKAEAEKK